MISINKDSISHINSSIPSLPKELYDLRGAQLPDGSLVISGGHSKLGGPSDEYLHYKEGFNRWRYIGTIKKRRGGHSSVWIGGRLLTTGVGLTGELISHHEESCFDGVVIERKEMPKALKFHTATTFDRNQMIVIGGTEENENNVSQISSKLRIESLDLNLKFMFCQNNMNLFYLFLVDCITKNIHL